MRRLLRFLSALRRFFVALLSRGVPAVATADVQQRRDLVCCVCPHLRGLLCTKCGCAQQLKILMATEECPDRRWFAMTRFSKGV